MKAMYVATIICLTITLLSCSTEELPPATAIPTTVVSPPPTVTSIPTITLIQCTQTPRPVPGIVEEEVREWLNISREKHDREIDIVELRLSGASPSHFDATSLLPGCTFYRAQAQIGIHYPRYMTVAVYEGQAYAMPDEFNQLIVDYGVRIDESNLMEFAKLFVLLHEAYETPRITFRDQTVIEEKCPFGLYQARLETWTEVHGVVVAWKFCIEGGQLRAYHIEVLAVREGQYVDDPTIPRRSVGPVGMFPLRIFVRG